MKSVTRIAKVKSSKRRSAPNTVYGTVPPLRVANVKRRPREYLTVKEVGKLLDGARERYGHRDPTMILVGYREVERVSLVIRPMTDKGYRGYFLHLHVCFEINHTLPFDHPHYLGKPGNPILAVLPVFESRWDAPNAPKVVPVV
jgi:hypothetical protein